jgi:hypothetical protein
MFFTTCRTITDGLLYLDLKIALPRGAPEHSLHSARRLINTRTIKVTRIQTQNYVNAILLEFSARRGESLRKVGSKMGTVAKIGSGEIALSA